MPGTEPRLRCYGNQFVETADGLGYGEADAKRVWRRVVSRARKVEYRNSDHALTEFASHGQLAEIVAKGRGAFPRVNDADWNVIYDTIKELVDPALILEVPCK